MQSGRSSPQSIHSGWVSQRIWTMRLSGGLSESTCGAATTSPSMTLCGGNWSAMIGLPVFADDDAVDHGRPTAGQPPSPQLPRVELPHRENTQRPADRQPYQHPQQGLWVSHRLPPPVAFKPHAVTVELDGTTRAALHKLAVEPAARLYPAPVPTERLRRFRPVDAVEALQELAVGRARSWFSCHRNPPRPAGTPTPSRAAYRGAPRCPPTTRGRDAARRLG